MRSKGAGRLAAWLLKELGAVVLLVAFVVALASMPPLRITPDPSGLGEWDIGVDTQGWKQNALTYLDTLRTGTLGVDEYDKPVAPLIAERLSNSLKLLGFAAALAVVLGVLKGIMDFRSLHRRRGALGPAITGTVQGIPDFWLILMLQLGFYWLEQTYGWRPFLMWFSPESQLRSMTLPVICLALIPGSYIARITSTALLEIWDREYIRTARSKGLHELNVLFKHAMRNAAVQILDGLPGAAAVMIANLLIVEYMFAYPGLTTKLILAVPAAVPFGQTRPVDVPVVAGAGMALGLTIALLHLGISAARRFADPRLKERESA